MHWLVRTPVGASMNNDSSCLSCFLYIIHTLLTLASPAFDFTAPAASLIASLASSAAFFALSPIDCNHHKHTSAKTRAVKKHHTSRYKDDVLDNVSQEVSTGTIINSYVVAYGEVVKTRNNRASVVTMQLIQTMTSIMHMPPTTPQQNKRLSPVAAHCDQ